MCIRDRCRRLQTEHQIVPERSWGTAPRAVAGEWLQLRCEQHLGADARPHANALHEAQQALADLKSQAESVQQKLDSTIDQHLDDTQTTRVTVPPQPGTTPKKDAPFRDRQKRKVPRLMFIHLPKNGGTSVRAVIGQAHLQIGMCYHNGGAKCAGDRQAVGVVRDPLDRFESAVRYAIQRYGGEAQIAKAYKSGLRTPSSWATALCEPEGSVNRTLVEAEILNQGKNKHVIDDVTIPWKWTYAPQSDWLDGLKYPLLTLRFNHMAEDWDTFLNVNGFPPAPMEQRNKSKKAETKGKTGNSNERGLSPEASACLSKIYAKDKKRFEAREAEIDYDFQILEESEYV
eukprot:TRINITY_DN7735_c0_g1_i4.p1 TRINITY_DN7735_c0_g1~~TRINITY_DN7735_c0_g1_i4.p1  ORF type:complete len:344 (-),score=62.44 TRINITY_DN7735_c0_g1_i4:152-1183(-)